MASIVLTAAGQAIAPGIGGALLGALGNIAGSYIDREVFGLGTGKQKYSGPRLENLKVQDSRYGAGIPVVYGRARVAGNVIWATNLAETRHEDRAGGGGKGGGSSSISTVRYTYSVSCAVGVCQGSIATLHAVWADGKQIYDGTNWKNGLVASVSFYQGDTSQLPDPVMQAALGAGNVPAYRGLAYIVLENLQLADFGNRLPNLTFEVSANDGSADPRWLSAASISLNAIMDPLRSLQGSAPLMIEGDSARARTLLISGYKTSGSTYQFEVVRYDVTGDEPQEIGRDTSGSFATISTVYDHAHAMSPDGRLLALQIQSTAPSFGQTTFVLYDIVARQFGTPFTLTAVSNGPKAIGWLDDLHFVVSDTSGTTRGVRLMARAGLGVIDRGFVNLWGAGTSTTRFDCGYAQYIPLKDGLLVLKADADISPTTLYACHIRMSGSGIVVGAPYVLTGSVPTTSGNYPNLLPLGDDEWVLAFSRLLDIRLASFRLNSMSATTTRPWQTITLGGNCTTNAPLLMSSGKLLVLQRYTTENNYRLVDIAITSGGFAMQGSAGTVVANNSAPRTYFGPIRLDYNRIAFQGGSIFSNSLVDMNIMQRQPAGDSLQAIVGDLLDRSGYSNTDYDLAALATTKVEGLVVSDPSAARQTIDVLRNYQPFDLVEVDHQLQARLRTGSADETIGTGELRAASQGDDPPPALQQLRAQELDLPKEVTIEHLDPARDYEVGAQRARRIVTKATATHKISLPLVCRASLGKQVAERSLFAAWAERDQVTIRLSRRYAYLAAGDVIQIANNKIRLTGLKQSQGLIEAEGLLLHADAYTSAATADTGAGSTRRAITVIPTQAYYLDLPLLARDHNQPGIYIAVTGRSGWTGATIWRASDSLHFTQQTSSTNPAAAGIAASVLSSISFSQSMVMDRANTITVQLLQGELASVTEDALFAGANAAVLGGEIIQFQTAILLGRGYYQLSNLLRGRRGTDDALASHVIGEPFVLLESSSVQFLPAVAADKGRSYQFRALSSAQNLADVQDINVTYGLKTLQPFSPVHVTGSRTAGIGSDLTINWKRRARMDAEWLDLVDVPLDEEEELYDVEIMNGSTVLRSFANITAPAQLYSAAQQTADWGTVPASFTVRIYQRSALYGRGQAATAIL